MATKTTTNVTLSAIAFIRAMDIQFTIKGAKPNTKLYAFFDSVSVDQYITPLGGGLGSNVSTDSSGNVSGKFSIPANTFNTGKRILKFQDSALYTADTLGGSTVSQQSAVFTSNGVLKTIQDTITTTVVVENNVIGGLGDPLAQSFFTYGSTGGVYISDIDIYFQSRDANLPVTIEIREMINGYPGPKLVSPNSRVVLPATSVNVSGASLTNLPATKFTFKYPVYLEENKDYCFVLLANTNNYNVWTSKLGEKSIETGKIVTDQPYIGSMFKSENNITWTADQTEDIKFTLNQAIFTPSTGTVNMVAAADKLLMYGKNVTVMNTTSGAQLKFKFDHLHGLANNDQVTILGAAGCSYGGSGSSRGITTAQISGTFSVTSVIDPYTIIVTLPGVTPTSTGTMECPGIINEIQIDNAGSGYTGGGLAAGDRISSSSGNTPIIGYVQSVNTNSGIASIAIVTPGSPYTVAPTAVSIWSNDGTTQRAGGASLYVISETVFQVETNRRIDEVKPKLALYSPADSTANATLTNMSETYSYNATPFPVTVNAFNKLPVSSLLLSVPNKAIHSAGVDSTALALSVSSSNPNISPILSLTEMHNLESFAYIINNQGSYENLSTLTSGSLIATGNSQTISVAGAGYTNGTVALTISAPDIATGVQAAGTVTIVGGALSSINITNVGSGYTKAPTITVTSGSPSLVGVITPVMSPIGGSASLIATGNSQIITQAGTGYTPATVALSISAPDLSTGVQAAGTATFSGGSLTSINITNVGSGYLAPPTITASSGTPTVACVITPVLTSFNTEILPTGGTAKSRYITKQYILATMSTGASVIVNACSKSESHFDVYIRTSLQANNVVHTAQNWTRLICATDTNLSINDQDFQDYKHELFGIAPFDVYDLKIVMRTTNRASVPEIRNFRAVITAT